jgi:HAUS augmin-like complex subunit 1
MAQHHRHLSEDTAIFSPSVARVAASNARDWSYVDSWLSSKLAGRATPQFERNIDTLKALLALASLNEAADEERQLIARAENDALAQLEFTKGSEEAGCFRERLLDAIKDELPREGQVALESLAQTSVQAGIAAPEPKDLGQAMVSSQQSAFAMRQMELRIQILQRHIERSSQRIRDFLDVLEQNEYQPSPELAKHNIELQRKAKIMSAQLPEMHDRAAALGSYRATRGPTIDSIAEEEQAYIELLAKKRHLDTQIGLFEGLSADPDIARSNLEALRNELHAANAHRDEMFEGLVERESPVKRRPR